MSSTTWYAPLERSRYFRDYDGVVSTSKREDEILQLVVDWSDELASAETISSVAYDASGVTTSGTSNTTTTSTVSVTGLGEIEVTATLSTARKLQKLFRFYDTSQGAAGDYA